MPSEYGKGSPADIAWRRQMKLMRYGKLMALSQEEPEGVFAIPDRELWAVLQRTHDAFKLRETRILKNFCLTPTQYIVLEFLCVSSTILTIGELVEALHMSYGNISTITYNLAKKGLAKSDYCDDDRRYKCIFVTDAGRDTFTKAHAVYSKVMSKLFGSISKHNKDALHNGLKQMLNHISGPEILQELE